MKGLKVEIPEVIYAMTKEIASRRRTTKEKVLVKLIEKAYRKTN